MIQFFAALICIIVGFLLAIIEGDFLFNSLVWFVAAIAINTLAPDFSQFQKKPS